MSFVCQLVGVGVGVGVMPLCLAGQP
jgi:hypothetical protein